MGEYMLVRRLALFLDSTWNTLAHGTNVSRLIHLALPMQEHRRRRGSSRWINSALASVVVAISLFFIGHHLLEIAEMVAGGIHAARILVDFQIYICAGSHITDPYGSCLGTEVVSGFIYPPPSLVYFGVLAKLPLAFALAVHSFISIALLGMASWMLARLTPVSRFSALIAILGSIAIAPIGTSLLAAQVNIIVMAACVAGVYFASTGAHVRSGCAIALGFWLKLYPIVVPALFMTPPKRPAAFMTMAMIAAVALLSLSSVSPSLFGEYFGPQLKLVQGHTRAGLSYSIAGIAAHIELGGGPPLDKFIPIPALAQFLSKAILAASIVIAMAHQWKTRDSAPMESLCILLTGALIAAPMAWSFHYALIYPALFLSLARTMERPDRWALLVFLCWLGLLIPGWTEPPAIIAESPSLNVLVRNRYAFIAIVLVFLTCRPWKTASADALTERRWSGTYSLHHPRDAL